MWGSIYYFPVNIKNGNAIALPSIKSQYNINNEKTK